MILEEFPGNAVSVKKYLQKHKFASTSTSSTLAWNDYIYHTAIPKFLKPVEKDLQKLTKGLVSYDISKPNGWRR